MVVRGSGWRDADAVLSITVSYNLLADNCTKPWQPLGQALDGALQDEIEARIEADDSDLRPWDGLGERVHRDGRERHVAALAEAVDLADPLSVVVDVGNGPGGVTADALQRLGCEVETLNAQPDGRFPGRDPEPVAERLGDLRRLVEAEEADLGFAHDGDADRAMFVDETGASLNGDAVLAALVAAHVDAGDTVVSAANASQRLIDVAEAAGADLSLTRIGSTYIITRVRELLADGESVPVAGEGNGGVIFPDYRIARDGAYTAARFLELVAERPASEVVDAYDDYHNARESLPYESDADREAMLGAIADTARGAVADLDRTVGYRLPYGDGWVLARESGTEPVIRIYAEAHTEDRARELVDVFATPVRRATNGPVHEEPGGPESPGPE
jgi:phosphomannomutase/phosphoglucomutase